MNSKYRVVRYWHTAMRYWVLRVEKKLEGAQSWYIVANGMTDLETAMREVRACKDDDIKATQDEVMWEDE